MGEIDTEILHDLFGYMVRPGHTVQSGAGTNSPVLVWADADYEIGDGVCGLHADQKPANEPSIPYVRLSEYLALRAENEQLRQLVGPAEELCVSITASDPWCEIDRRLVACSNAVANARAALEKDETDE